MKCTNILCSMKKGNFQSDELKCKIRKSPDCCPTVVLVYKRNKRVECDRCDSADLIEIFITRVYSHWSDTFRVQLPPPRASRSHRLVWSNPYEFSFYITPGVRLIGLGCIGVSSKGKLQVAYAVKTRGLRVFFSLHLSKYNVLL